MVALHYLLLNLRLFFFELYQLLLHEVVIGSLLNDLLLEVVKILDDLGVDKLNIFIVNC